MFESRHGSGGGSSANRWLIVAGAGLVILAFVARMLLDVGHTKVSDLAGVLRPDTVDSTATPAPAPVDTVAAPPAAADAQALPPPDTATNPAPPAPPAAPNPSASQTAAPPAGAPSSPAPRGTHVTVAKPPPVLRMDTTTPGSRYVVQIGAFGSEANAAKLSQRASALGYEATVIAQVRGDATLYLVRVIRAGSPADARIVSDSLANTLGVNAVVLRPDQ